MKLKLKDFLELDVTGKMSYNVTTATPNFTCGFEVDKILQASLAI